MGTGDAAKSRDQKDGGALGTEEPVVNADIVQSGKSCVEGQSGVSNSSDGVTS